MKTAITACVAVVLLVLSFPPETVFAQATVFSDDFESGKPSSKWGLYRRAEDTVVAVPMATAPAPLTGGGSYIGLLQDVDVSYTGAAIALAGSSTLQDYSIEADVYCYVNTSVSAYTGLCVYSDSAKGTYIKMAADFDASKRIRLSNNRLDTATFLPTFDYTFNAASIPGGIPTADGWHKMKVEVRTISDTKTGFWCYFDGNVLAGCPVIDSSKHVMRSGKFGLYSFQQDADGIAAYFDNVVVKFLPTPVNFSETFESGKPGPQWGLYRKAEDSVVAVPMASAPAPLAGGGSYVGLLQDVDVSYTGAAIALAGTTNLRDYSIQGDVYCYVNAPVSAYTGLCVYSDSSRGTYIKMAADFDASKRIRLSNNRLDPVTFLPTFDYTFNAASIPGGIPTADGWHKMKIEVRSLSGTKTAFWCYFDGNVLAGCPVIDSSIHVMNSGKFGLYSFQQDADGIAAYFDNIVVGDLPTTSVEPSVLAGSLPGDYHLQQNFPNPFNPETRIVYSVTESDLVSLIIFDQLGRTIKTLVSEKRPVGVHSITWNGKNDHGTSVPSGVYYYALRSGSVTETRKMVLLR